MDARTRAARIRLVAFDIDGVMTDGGLHYTDDGQELKTFNVHDGLGLKDGIGRRREETFPKAPYRHLPDVAFPIRRGEGVLEDAILGHQGHNGVYVVAVERRVELVDNL